MVVAPSTGLRHIWSHITVTIGHRQLTVILGATDGVRYKLHTDSHRGSQLLHPGNLDTDTRTPESQSDNISLMG